MIEQYKEQVHQELLIRFRLWSSIGQLLCYHDMCHRTLNKRRLYSSSQKLVSTTSRVIIYRPYCHDYQRSKSSYPDPEAISSNLSKDKKTIAQNLESQARYAQALVIWTDCDREGEHIGNEIVEAARKGKPGIQVLRARFSNVERAYVVMSS